MSHTAASPVSYFPQHVDPPPTASASTRRTRRANPGRAGATVTSATADTTSAAIRAAEATSPSDPLNVHAMRILLYDARLTALTTRAANDRAARALLTFLDASGVHDLVTKIEDDRSRDVYATPSAPPAVHHHHGRDSPSTASSTHQNTLRAFRAATRAAKVERRITTHLENVRDSVDTSPTANTSGPVSPSAAAAIRSLLEASHSHRAYHMASVNRALSTWPKPPPIRDDVPFSVNAHLDQLRKRARPLDFIPLETIEALRARPLARERSKLSSLMKSSGSKKGIVYMPGSAQPVHPSASSTDPASTYEYDSPDDPSAVHGYQGSPPKTSAVAGPSSQRGQVGDNQNADQWTSNSASGATADRSARFTGPLYNQVINDADDIDGLYDDDRNNAQLLYHDRDEDESYTSRQGPRRQTAGDMDNAYAKRSQHQSSGYAGSPPDIQQYSEGPGGGDTYPSEADGHVDDGFDVNRNIFDPPPPAGAGGFSRRSSAARLPRSRSMPPGGRPMNSPPLTSATGEPQYSAAHPYAAPWPPSPHYYYLPPYGHPYGHFPPMYDGTQLHFTLTDRLLRDTPSRVAGYKPGVYPSYDSSYDRNAQGRSENHNQDNGELFFEQPDQNDGYGSAPESTNKRRTTYDFGPRRRNGNDRRASDYYDDYDEEDDRRASRRNPRTRRRRRNDDEGDEGMASDPGSRTRPSRKRSSKKDKSTMSRLADIVQSDDTRQFAGALLEHGGGLPRNIRRLRSMHKAVKTITGQEEEKPNKPSLAGQVAGMAMSGARRSKSARGRRGRDSDDDSVVTRGRGSRSRRNREREEEENEGGGVGELANKALGMAMGGKNGMNAEALGDLATGAMNLWDSRKGKGEREPSRERTRRRTEDSRRSRGNAGRAGDNIATRALGGGRHAGGASSRERSRGGLKRSSSIVSRLNPRARRHESSDDESEDGGILQQAVELIGNAAGGGGGKKRGGGGGGGANIASAIGDVAALATNLTGSGGGRGGKRNSGGNELMDMAGQAIKMVTSRK